MIKDLRLTGTKDSKEGAEVSENINRLAKGEINYESFGFVL